MAINKIKTNSISDSAVTSASIQDSAVTNAKISACAAIAQSKVTGLATSLSTLCSSATSLTGLINTNQFNIGLLGFKMAITEGLTVFNLVDGIVDEFEDESGVDNSASTSLTYNSTDDYYINSSTPDGDPAAVPYSAGFTTTTITEPDTSVAGTNPGFGTMVGGTFTVPTGATSVNAYIWGAGGGAGGHEPETKGFGGGGGFVEGTVAVTPSQVIGVFVAEGGQFGLPASPSLTYGNGGGFGVHPSFPGTQKGGGGVGPGGLQAAGGAGLGAIASQTSSAFSAPTMFLVSGGGGGGGSPNGTGGAGGGLIGDAYNTTTEQTNRASPAGGGGGGSQTTGGQGGTGPVCRNGQSGGLFYGGNGYFGGGGGGGYYGGGGSGYCGGHPAGGGGSSYYGHPQITSGSTEEGQGSQGGGVPSPLYTASTNEGGTGNLPSPQITSGEDGFILLTATGSTPATTTSSTIISDPFTANTVPTTTRIVVFEENVGTPSLNTDIIASVSRNGGTNFTNVTLADSGYVTGSSGQRILTGTATISGQPSGQSMKWKLQLANNTVKIHGVALQWS